MSNEDSLEVRQENELQALKAIFNDDLRDFNATGSGKEWKPLNIVITLSPLQDSNGLQEIHVQVDLHITCTKNYPNVEPEIQLERSRGISDSLLLDLKTQLKKRATELKGEVMVYELTQHVKTFLHEHNQPRYKSFYDEMLNRQRQQEELRQKMKELEESRKRQLLQDEIQRRQESLRLEDKYRREHSTTSSSTGIGTSPCKHGTRGSSDCDSDSIYEYVCQHDGTELLLFEGSNERKVQKGKCLFHSNRGYVIYSGLDLNSGEMLTVTEWKVNMKDQDVNALSKHINSCDQEITYLSKLMHLNLVKYLNMKSVQHENETIIYIIQEFVTGVNCNALYVEKSISTDIGILRHIASGVLSALEFLHRNNVVYKELKNTRIFLDNNGIVKVSGYSLEVKLWEIVANVQSTECYNKKTDIYKFGLCMLSLLKGCVVDEPDTLSSLGFPVDLTDFLSKCLTKDDKSRLNATQLLEHPFVRIPLYRTSPKRLCKMDIPPEVISPSKKSVENLKTLSQTQSGGPSRFSNEFEQLLCLGRGAYGYVYKVRNKLDSGYYAIKRIELDPKNRHLNRKITKEVKLLSRLNHENVVRYYNSWIETAVLLDEQFSEDSHENTKATVNTANNDLDFGNDIELLAPPIKDIEWSTDYDGQSKHAVEDSSSTTDDESSDEEGSCMNLFVQDMEISDGIEFEADSNTPNNVRSDSSSYKDTPSTSKANRERQFMYIQMELCEKSTLRTAIDNGLHKDDSRIWRLFREIVEGLAHIHQQGMIHRDLKPVNIFLDLHDHVKIGDFGLATTNIIQKQPVEVSREIASQDGTDASLTGKVGTLYYIAPELNTCVKATYNQKVDLYSLGIIFFEMCYGGTKTGMERDKILSSLRSKDIVFPTDFLDTKYEKQRQIISLLLNHDVSKRPTSQELLQSEYLPPPVLKERELRELVRHTLTNPQSKNYKYLVASCFGQDPNSIEDITYYMSLPAFNSRLLNLQELLKQTIVKIFKQHGGQCLSTPLIMPKSDYYKDVESCVKLMTHSGSIVSIPHDLRVPFARYVAWNNINSLKRYSIDRVYREKKMFGFHPRELYECAFDVVTPTLGSLMADAEVLSILDEIVNEFSALKNKSFLIKLNHVLLVQAMLLHCGISKEKHQDICSLLSDAREGKVKSFQIKSHLMSLCLTETAITKLFNFIETDCQPEKLSATIKRITSGKTDASTMGKRGLTALKQIIDNAKALGVKTNIVISLGLAYNVHQYSGMMCQLVCEMKKKRRGGFDVLAAGGRYDDMLAHYRQLITKSGLDSRDISQSAVGISISLDKFVQALQEEQFRNNELDNLDVLICTQGCKPMVLEKAKILRDLRSVGLKYSLIETQTLEEIQELHTELRPNYLVIMKDTEQRIVRLRTREKDRFQDNRVSIDELVDFVQRHIKIQKECLNEGSSYSSFIHRSESKVNTSEHNNANLSRIRVNIVMPTKGPMVTRKRLENQISSNLSSTLQRLSPKEHVVIYGLDLEASVIKTLAALLDLEKEETLRRSIIEASERHPRDKKYFSLIQDELITIMGSEQKPIIILCSTRDTTFRVLV